MLSEILSEIICYTLTAMGKGSMWWWILPLAPDVPERLVVGHERAFLTWFSKLPVLASFRQNRSMNICGRSPDSRACLER